MARLSLLIFLVSLWPHPGASQESTLQVARGGRACVHPSTLRLQIIPGQLCRVSVLRGSYLQQTVGSIYPKEFQCDFRPEEVCYEHSGSPHLLSDLVPLQILRYLDGRSSITIKYLKVEFRRETPKHVVLPDPGQWAVPPLETKSESLTSAGLYFTYNILNSNCYVTLNPTGKFYPVVGKLSIPDTRTNVSLPGFPGRVSFTEQCQRFLLDEVRYMYTDVLPLRRDFISIQVEVTSAGSSTPVKERLFIPVRLPAEADGRPPKVSVRESYKLIMKPCSTRILDPEFALAMDDTTPQDALRFLVRNISDPTFGYFAFRHDPMVPVFSFSQAEVRSHQIVFKSLKEEDEGESSSVVIELVVVDLELMVSRPVYLPVVLNYYRSRDIEVYLVHPLRVPFGQIGILSSDNLKLRVKTEKDLLFVVRDGLYSGKLTVRGRRSHKFTPDDVARGLVTYKHKGRSEENDFILLRVKEGKKKRARVTIPISIIPKANNPPKLANNTILYVRNGQLAQVTSAYLATVVRNTTTVTYFIQDHPRSGELLKLSGQTFTGGLHSFTQDDINRGLIFYKHRGSSLANDSLTFTLKTADESRSIRHEFIINIKEPFGKLEKARLTYTKLVTPYDEVGIISKDHLQYFSTNGPVHYKIREQPFCDGRIACGKLLTTDTDQEAGKMRYSSVKPVYEFKQEDIDSGRIEFIPAPEDAYTLPQVVSILYDVTDSAGNALYNQMFNISVIGSEGDPAWEVKVKGPQIVNEGENVVLSREKLNVTSRKPGTLELTFNILQKPQWGILEREVALSGTEEVTESFTLDELTRGAISYSQNKHSAVEPMSDSVKFTVTDGRRSDGPYSFDIIVIPKNDEMPTIGKTPLEVEEGGTLVITKDTLPINDLDIPEDILTVEVLSAPDWGKLLLTHVDNNTGEYITVPAEKFTKQSLGQNKMLVYKHDGSENFQDDISIRVTDGVFTTKGSILLLIKPVNDEIPETIRNTELTVEPRTTREITRNELETIDLDNKDNDIYYLIYELPSAGHLQYRQQPPGGVQPRTSPDIYWKNIKLGQNFTQEDINQRRIRYVPGDGYFQNRLDKFVFVVSDGAHALPHQTFRLVVNEQNGGSTIRPPVIDNQREQSYNPDTLNEVLGKPTIDPELIKSGKHIVPANKFASSTQSTDEYKDYDSYFGFDDDMKVRPSEGGTTKPEVGTDAQRRQASNSSYSNKQVLPSVPSTTETNEAFPRLPNLIVNTPLSVRLGGHAVLTPDNLKIEANGVSDTSLKYVIMKRPDHGVLFRDFQQVNSYFTQNDINKQSITYKHTKGDTQGDEFLFRITDGNHDNFLVNGSLASRVVKFRVTIRQPVDEPPQLTILKEPDNLMQLGRNRYGYILGSSFFKATHPDATGQEITYLVKDRPSLGYLEYVSNGRLVNRRFTQEDLDNTDIRYVINSKLHESNDSFTVTLMDPWGHVSKEYRLDLRWSLVQFDMPEYIVCEDVDAFTITVKRQGNLDQPCSVRVKVKALSAKIKEDFIPSDARVIHFQKGEDAVGWRVRIRRDNREESVEKFRVLLRSPTNAVVAARHKTVIRIVDYKNGHCEEYLGMIRKDERNPLGMVVQPSARVATTDISSDSGDTVWARDRSGRRKGQRRIRLSTTVATTTTAIPTTTAYQPASQPCTKHRRGLMYYDMLTQTMYKCDGSRWVRMYRRYAVVHSPPARDEAAKDCPPDWERYNSECYKVFDEKVSWYTGQQECKNRFGANLANVQSQRHLRELVKLSSYKHFWTGLTNRHQIQQWEYVGLQPVNYVHWKTGYPKESRSRRCVLVNHKGQMVNKPCHRIIARYICSHELRELP